MDELKTKRSSLKAKLTRLQTSINVFVKNDEKSVNLIKVKREAIQACFTEFEVVQDQIEEDFYATEEDRTREDRTRSEVEEKYFNLLALVDDLIAEFSDGKCQSQRELVSTPEQKPNLMNIPLPPINLPKFAGSYTEYTNFIERFNKTVDSNKFISDADKLAYLKGCVVGDAAETINSLSISDPNYQVALQLLKKRYANLRLIVQGHVDNILNSPCLNKNSPETMRRLINDVNVNLAALQSLNVNVENWDPIIVPIISRKLDFQSSREWEMLLNVDVPKLAELIGFLEKRFHILQSLKNIGNLSQVFNGQKGHGKSNLSTTAVSNQRKNDCVVCQSTNHNVVFKCPTFLALEVEQRIKKSKQLNLCVKCLLPARHVLQKCKFNNCKVCKGEHNNLLHKNDEVQSQVSTQIEISPNVDADGTNLCTKNSQIQEVMLSTAIVSTLDSQEIRRNLRCLLDNGSQNCFITESACKSLNLTPDPIKFQVSSIDQGSTSISQAVKLKIFSNNSTFSTNILCLIVKNITGKIPNRPIKLVGIPKNLVLADKGYGTPGEIHLLLGAEVFWNILKKGCLHLGTGLPTVQNTVLGHVIGGPVINRSSPSGCTFFLKGQNGIPLEPGNCLEYPQEIIQVKDNDICETHFRKSFQRDNDGRFVVELVFKSCRPALGTSHAVALKRFLHLEQRLYSNPSLFERYKKGIQEYIDLKHMVEVPQNSIICSSEHFYLPHQAVFKDTRTRIVFDGSSKSSTGISLNDILCSGPALQQDLFGILCRFRTHQYVITADISKMYRQIWLNKKQHDYQRVLWRASEDEKIKTYQLTTVTFGLACSPYLAIRCVRELAFENQVNSPEASTVILNDIFVDDLLTGCNTIHELLSLRNQIIKILDQAKFSLHKWRANDPKLLEGLQNNVPGTNQIKLSGDIKTLGLIWNTEEDQLKFDFNYREPDKITKRTVSSVLGQIFDPIGLISPITVTAKIILQKLWSLNLQWDEIIPLGVLKEFRLFLKSMENCGNIIVPRKVISGHPYKHIELHVFTDASEKAYGCCIYMRTLDLAGNYNVTLICSKSKVAPMQSITIPKLELCAALVGAQLADKVVEHLKLNFHKQYFWSDSTVALSWITTPYHKSKVYVANRVKTIQALTPPESWYYVPTAENPADWVSRGVTAKKLVNSNFWWQGPSFLRHEISQVCFSAKTRDDTRDTDTTVLLVVPEVDLWVNTFNRFSTFTKLLRAMAYVFRFINRIKGNKVTNNQSLSVDELQKTESFVLGIAQKIAFKKDNFDLDKNSEVDNKSKLLSLKPFLDEHGLIRVGGRLNHAHSVGYNEKHPIILPSGNHVTRLIVHREHKKLLHAGIQTTLYSLRKMYWILKGRSEVKYVVKRCIVCFRCKPTPTQPLMGDLPSSRFEQIKPFHNCGVDFAGPFVLRLGPPRSKKTAKAYLCIFVCLATKAVHLELIGDLTTNCFLNAFRRLISRRGRVQNVYSDNAKTFVKANKDLGAFVEFYKSPQFTEVNNYLISELNVTWHFIPPNSPNFGGIWERAVRSAKHHIKRVVGKTMMNYEEFNTVFTLIEHCLNSRPISPLSDDPDDLLPLTPNHFLIGERSAVLPELDLSATAKNQLKRYQLLQKLRQDVWKRWRAEYFNLLQQRNKWKTNTGPTVQVGDLVIIKSDNTLPSQWPTGRVLELFKGKDDIARVANVKTLNGVFKRPISKLCVLPIN